MTPDEFANQRADRWQIAVALRTALAEGIKAARSEKQGWQRLDTMQTGEVG